MAAKSNHKKPQQKKEKQKPAAHQNWTDWTVYVVRKQVPVYESMFKGAQVVYRAQFGQKMLCTWDMVNGWLMVQIQEFKKTKDDKPKTYKGFVRKAWVSLSEVHDIARLKYQNLTEKTFPTSLIYGGKADGCIEPGEEVSVLAYCSPFALTSKGWARTDLIYHEEDMTENCLVLVPPEDKDGMTDLFSAVISMAVQDYAENMHQRHAISKWTESEWFQALWGGHTEEFMKRCRKAAEILDEQKFLKPASEACRRLREELLEKVKTMMLFEVKPERTL